MTTATRAISTAAKAFEQAPADAKAGGVPRGRPVSGRVWKTTQKTRFSSQTYKATKTLSTTWEQKVEKRAKLQNLKDLEAEIKARRQAEKDERKREREEREKRRAENELKSASVQVVRGWLYDEMEGVLLQTNSFMSPYADFASKQTQDHEQKAAAQHQEDYREQAGRRRVRARLLQVIALPNFNRTSSGSRVRAQWTKWSRVCMNITTIRYSSTSHEIRSLRSGLLKPDPWSHAGLGGGIAYCLQALLVVVIKQGIMVPF
jgi:hypothetical protein